VGSVALDLPVDVEAIARKALSPSPGQSPDDVIESELQRAGIPGGFSSSREYRELWHLCATTYADLRAKVPARDPETITAEVLWASYDQGLSQYDMARLWGLGAANVAQRSIDAGFVLSRRADYSSGRHVIAEGPCLRCGASYDVSRLDKAHACDSCRR
jgi:hypothetical protein